eukprot:CAMPEP_0204823302 /NCGR_PEP_ID=MMETSP1346-20131115/1355_1 /ASSEMBLY_ACC=CAM_ASM_000771 /TAXON_ID=215587 /ORGANISM="Aplanochytrium stocchinoi, Strain GSBS06" /LENGTH=620 /DNA_ID=CAMNT_0051949879 /DNA_START=349 /DNA_END=2206 /DNA_ORIENTATION=-
MTGWGGSEEEPSIAGPTLGTSNSSSNLNIKSRRRGSFFGFEVLTPRTRSNTDTGTNRTGSRSRNLRRRAHTDYVTSEHFVKVNARRSRGRFSSLTDIDLESRERGLPIFSHLLQRREKRAQVVAVDTGVLNSYETVRDRPAVVEEVANLAEPEPEATEVPTCLICYGRATRKKPLIPIPCTAKCNLSTVHMKCIYEWREQKKGTGTCILCRSALGEIDYTPPDLLKTSSLVIFELRKQFNVQPIPKGAGMVRCYIAVRNGFWGSPATFEMYLQAPTTCSYPGGPLPDECSPHNGDRLLMCAKKRLSRWGGSQIEIGMDKTDFPKKSHNYLGMVQSSSALGLEHSILLANGSQSNGNKVHGNANPESRLKWRSSSTNLSHENGNGIRNGHREIGCVLYRQNRLGSESGPRKMRVLLPQTRQVEELDAAVLALGPHHSKVLETKSECVGSSEEIDISVKKREIKEYDSALDDYSDDDDSDWDDDAHSKTSITGIHNPGSKKDTLISILKRKSTGELNMDETEFHNNFLSGQNKKPYWLDSIGAHSLDFAGRVTLPSNKNFQLELDGCTPETNALQFGKVTAPDGDSDCAIYTVDFRYPLSPIQAFGIALSSCDRKLACAVET